MFRNYLITALRNFTRHKLYSFINIAGLTVGLACAIFVVLLVRDELSYDKWIAGSENLYRIDSTVHVPGQSSFSSELAAFPIPDAMKAEIPEVTAAVHLEYYPMTVTAEKRQFLDHVNVVSSNFLEIIKLPMIAGSPATAFIQPESAVITETAAKKYFGDALAIGKALKVGGQCQYGPGVEGCTIREATVLVTGIVRDLPHNTQLAGDVFIPNTSAADPMAQTERQSWLTNSGYGYVRLAPNTDPRLVEGKLATLIDRSVDLSKMTGMRIRASQVTTFRLTPFRDVHLAGDSLGGMTSGGSWTMVYGFTAIAVLILLVACFNFTNLATARALTRAREISLRKTVGAKRSQLAVQFLSESVLTALLSVILAFSLTEMLLPIFDRIAGKSIPLHYIGDWPFTLALIGIAVATGLLAGAYPAWVLSGFRPASALRAKVSEPHGSGMVRTILVVMQFAVSIGLGIAVLVVFAQISFARTIDLGFNKNGLIVVRANNMTFSARQSLVRALAADPALRGAALSSDIPFSGNTANGVYRLPGMPGSTVMRTLSVGPDFFSLYGIRLLSGRAFSWGDMGQKHKPLNILINAAAAKRFGLSPESALGKGLFALEGMQTPPQWDPGTIIGVTSDFMFDGDRRQVAPTIYVFDPDSLSRISVKVPGGSVPQALAAIDRTWGAFAPSVAINRHFLDTDFEQQFQSAERQETIFRIFVIIAIFIACLGLFGLAAFSTERRIREIGLRKAFGAETKDIVLMLLWQFSMPVLIANLIAWPLTYYYLRIWLDGYAYRIGLSPVYFLAAGAAALMIAWATVFAHASRVARANPIHALRYE